ncbi:hypothetical protein GCM10009416_27750 [Craurococcus roseus]|uniref:Lipase n=1 Tax=Craurococcus roseus TaxID=77585 RepID=A0ABN1FCB4_9PROT
MVNTSLALPQSLGLGGVSLSPLLDAVAAGAPPIAVLADFAAALPEPLRGPDDTPSVATGASDASRAEALSYTTLAAVPRLVDALGPQATGIVVGGEAFAVAETYEDAVTGFHAVQLRSLSDGRAVFALDDTNFESLADVVADLDLARPQASSPAFAAMVADAETAAIAEGNEVAFVGASLGGALAQVAGYETAEAVLAAATGHAERIEVFGVDPLGGRDAAESLNGGALDPAVLAWLDAVHVRTEGDIVSRVSSHLGDTITFQAVDAGGNPVVLTADEAHVNLESLFTNLSSDALFAAGERGDPGEIGGLALLANAVGPGLSDAFADAVRDGLIGPPPPVELRGSGAFNPTGRFFDLDADRDGDVDIRALLNGATPSADDLLIA